MTEESTSYPFIVHGSADSTDHDVVFILPKMLLYHEALKFCNYKKAENRNIMTMYNCGVVKQCMKGLPDEINNSLIVTYPLHEQVHEMPIKQRVTRIIPLKVVRALRSILSHLSKSSLRTSIKPALRSFDLGEYIRVLDKVDFNEQSIVKLLDVEICKMLGFQIGQTLALLEGSEIYTKGQIAEQYPELTPFMRREEDEVLTSLDSLNVLHKRLLQHLKKIKITPIVEYKVSVFTCSSPVEEDSLEIYEQCSNILVIDMQPGKERCLYFGHINHTLMREDQETLFCFKVVDGPIVTLGYKDGEIHQRPQAFDEYPRVARFTSCCTAGCTEELESVRIEEYHEQNALDVCYVIDGTPKIVGARDRATNTPVSVDHTLKLESILFKM